MCSFKDFELLKLRLVLDVSQSLRPSKFLSYMSEIPPILTACVSAPIEEAGLCQLVLNPLKTSKKLIQFSANHVYIPLLICRIIKYCSLVNEMPSVIIKVILTVLPLQKISRDLVKKDFVNEDFSDRKKSDRLQHYYTVSIILKNKCKEYLNVQLFGGKCVRQRYYM